jgi:predicted  nucleic acid-binding Zn-ribbon protein
MENLDQRKPECPYCHGALKKIPSKKTKCPQCGNSMFVRTRPRDRVRVVVTDQEAKNIENEWIVYGEEQAAEEAMAIAKKYKEISAANLREWKESEVVKTVKVYCTMDEKVCAICQRRNNLVLKLEDANVGVTVPPFADCSNVDDPKILRCRCYWTPQDISLD